MSKKIQVKCELEMYDGCKKTFIMWDCDYVKNKKRNGGKLICLNCAKNRRMFNNETSHKLYKNINYFDEIDSDLKAYMLGIIAGDGSLSKRTLRVVSHPKDIETLELFKVNICPEAQIMKYKNENCYFIDICSTLLSAKICQQLNITYGKKSDDITLPKLPLNLTWAFIRGLMDSDGWISNIITSSRSFPVCAYASRSTKIKEQIKKICIDNNIKFTCDNVSIIFNGINAIKFMDKIYENANVYLSRKKELYEMAKTWVPQKGSPFRPRKIRKDKGIAQGPRNFTEEVREKIREANRKRKGKSKIKYIEKESE